MSHYITSLTIFSNLNIYSLINNNIAVSLTVITQVDSILNYTIFHWTNFQLDIEILIFLLAN